MDRNAEQFRIIQREMQATALLAHHRTANNQLGNLYPDYAAPANYLRRGNGRNMRLFLVGAWLSAAGPVPGASLGE